MRYALILLLPIVTSPAWADWVQIHRKAIENNVVVFYLDPKTIRKDGEYRRVWALHEFEKREKGAISLRALHQYHCRKERTRILSFSVHSERMAEGTILSHGDAATEWMYIAPGSIGEHYLKFVCG